MPHHNETHSALMLHPLEMNETPRFARIDYDLLGALKHLKTGSVHRKAWGGRGEDLYGHVGKTRLQRK